MLMFKDGNCQIIYNMDYTPLVNYVCGYTLISNLFYQINITKKMYTISFSLRIKNRY